MKELKQWLSENDVKIDELGRVVIENERVLQEINGAVGEFGFDPVKDNGGCSCTP